MGEWNCIKTRKERGKGRREEDGERRERGKNGKEGEGGGRQEQEQKEEAGILSSYLNSSVK